MSQAAKHQPDPLAHYRDVGAHLREVREYYKLNVEEVAARLHIRPKYIKALEEGRMQDMPGRVYTLGYLQNYAEFLGLNATQVVEHYQNLKLMDAQRRFRVVEPLQRQGKPATMVIVACMLTLLLGLGIWQFLAQPAEPQTATLVEPVPERLQPPKPAALELTARNRACLAEGAAAYPPCFRLAEPPLSGPFLLKSFRHPLEVR